MNPCIEIQALCKSFGSKQLFLNANLIIQENTITAVSGRNASGKTTLLKLISGLLLPDSGKILLYNIDITKNRNLAKKYISCALNTDFGFYPYLTVKENIKFLCRIYNSKLNILQPLIDELSLKDAMDTKFAYASSGTKTKLWLLSSLVKQPKLLLIDELSKSVDENTKFVVYNLIKTLKEHHKITIVFVSHSAQEIELLADHWIKIENFSFVKLK